VALFRVRAAREARRAGDRFSIDSATRADELAELLRLARGCRHAVELGTGTAWTTISLALADRRRQVTSYDPVTRPERERYLGLVPERVRRRIRLLERPGASGPPPNAPPADFLFVDSSHEREETIAELRAWRDALAPGAVVVFHDYAEPAYPGVGEAIRELRLQGEAIGHLFAWRAYDRDEAT
jgi:predicted O-methyltransferase YrrM